YYDSAAAGGAAGQIYYQCSSNAGANWSAAVNITQNDGGTDFETPRFTQGTDGTLYMLIRGTRNGLPQSGWPPFRHFMFRSATANPGCAGNWLHPVQDVTPGPSYEFTNTFGGLITSGA